MLPSQVREFEEVGVTAAVLRADGEFIGIDKNGILDVPEGVQPTLFHLVVGVEIDGRTFVVQKNTGIEGGAYSRLPEFERFGRGLQAVTCSIPVLRAGSDAWTSWHAEKPNRVDCYHIGKDGRLDLYQIGIFSPDNGKSWRLHGEYRWRGQLYRQNGNGLVAKPDHPRWGSFEAGTARRTQIFCDPKFRILMRGVKLEAWTGSDAGLNPPLPEAPAGCAVMQWYIGSFAGQTGQGPANLHQSGATAWVCGCDIVGLEPDGDGIRRLWRGDIVSYEEAVPSRSGKPPFLKEVRLVKRNW